MTMPVRVAGSSTLHVSTHINILSTDLLFVVTTSDLSVARNSFRTSEAPGCGGDVCSVVLAASVRDLVSCYTHTTGHIRSDV